MDYLFTHTDDDGDHFTVCAEDVDRFDVDGLIFRNDTKDLHSSVSVGLSREAALRLYDVLGGLLYPVHTPEHANRSLIEQMIERAVKDQVAAVLPLHLTEQARYVDAGPDGTPYCRIEGCTFPSTPGAVHFEHDPEPHDVGHPEPVELPNVCYCELKDWPHTTHPGTADTTAKWDAEIRRDAGRSLATPYCRFCGHSWSRHTCSGGCGVRTSAAVCGCEEVRP